MTISLLKVTLPKIKSTNKYISFTHESQELNKKSFIFKNLRKKNVVGIQHRGYTVYKKTSYSLGNIAHGNFGGITFTDKISSSAVQRNNEFKYTTMYLFKKTEFYDLVFNNPTAKELKIKILFRKL